MPRPALPEEVRSADALVNDPGGRAAEIDAIRGWASLSVVFYHVFWETFGGVVPWFRNPYTAGLISGPFDVILFFILSGDALSHPFFHGGGVRYLQRAAIKRYLRLMVPILVVTIAVALAMAAHLTFNAPAGDIVGRPEWLGGFIHFKATGARALQFAFHDVFSGDWTFTFLPFLWTMPIELFGSFALILTILVTAPVRFGAVVVAACAWVAVDNGYYAGCFLSGMLLGQARAAGLYDAMPVIVGRLIAPSGVALVYVYVAQMQAAGHLDLRTLAVPAILLLLCIYASRPIVAFLCRSRVSQVLGRISYLLYLWHFVVLVTITSYLITVFGHRDGISTVAALGISAVTLAASLGLSRITLPIEGWTRSLNALLLRAVWREKPEGSERPGTRCRRPPPPGGLP